jgi:hypothetical protein
MSDTQQGPGWWQATDGKWYPPETHPARQVPPPVQPPTPGYQAPIAGYSVPPHSYAVPAPGFPGPPTIPPQWGGPYPPYPGAPGAPYMAARQTNGLAIASLVCSVTGIIPFFFGISCVVGIVLGFVSLRQIKRTGGVQQGRGLAIAGIAVGFSLIAIFVLLVGLAVGTAHTTTTSGT